MQPLKNARGNVLIFATLIITLLLIMVGMGLDTGHLAYIRSQGQPRSMRQRWPLHPRFQVETGQPLATEPVSLIPAERIPALETITWTARTTGSIIRT